MQRTTPINCGSGLARESGGSVIWMLDVLPPSRASPLPQCYVVDSGSVSTFLNVSTSGRKLIRCHAAHNGVVKLDLSEAQPDGFLLAGRYTLLDHDRARQRLMDSALAQNVEIVVGGPYSSGILAGGAHFEYQKASPVIISKVEQIKPLIGA